jgi:hypothetical protein
LPKIARGTDGSDTMSSSFHGMLARTTWPALRVACHACSIPRASALASNAKSTPRGMKPPTSSVSSWTIAITSPAEGSTASVAPRASAISRRSGIGSTAMMRFARAMRAAWT